jgi:acetyl-CoA/propionyl-CoA carboxylase, biotin carboxylase, biotin carboxyl carrier protein
MGEQALAAATACGYTNAGTVEFIVSAIRPDEPFFMEMNTRLQVEHPVTEMVWGLDLVEQQLRVAAGEAARVHAGRPAPVRPRRRGPLYAEDPAAGFVPSPGLALPGSGSADGGEAGSVRVDAGVSEGDLVTVHYDPMIAKVVAHGADRSAALVHLDHALRHSRVAGVATNIGFLRRLLADPDVVAGRLDTGLVERRLDALSGGAPPSDVVVADVVVAAAMAVAVERSAGLDASDPWNRRDGWRLTGHAPVVWRASVGETQVVVSVAGVRSPMPGSVVSVNVAEGDAVAEGQVVVSVEAMKMEHALRAPFDGVVAEVSVVAGAQVDLGATLAVITPLGEPHDEPDRAANERGKPPS